MEGYDFIWLGSIVIGMTLVAWLVLDWLESAQQWESYDVDAAMGEQRLLGKPEHTMDPLDVELELMLSYPLDPFAPTLLWRPTPQDSWIEGQEAQPADGSAEPSPVTSLGQPTLRPGSADLA